MSLLHTTSTLRSSRRPHYVCSVFRRRLERERLNRFTHCFRLTRSTEDNGELYQLPILPKSLRASLPLFSPCFAEGQSVNDNTLIRVFIYGKNKYGFTFFMLVCYNLCHESNGSHFIKQHTDNSTILCPLLPHQEIADNARVFSVILHQNYLSTYVEKCIILHSID